MITVVFQFFRQKYIPMNTLNHISVVIHIHRKKNVMADDRISIDSFHLKETSTEFSEKKQQKRNKYLLYLLPIKIVENQ